MTSSDSSSRQPALPRAIPCRGTETGKQTASRGALPAHPPHRIWRRERVPPPPVAKGLPAPCQPLHVQLLYPRGVGGGARKVSARPLTKGQGHTNPKKMAGPGPVEWKSTLGPMHAGHGHAWARSGRELIIFCKKTTPMALIHGNSSCPSPHAWPNSMQCEESSPCVGM